MASSGINEQRNKEQLRFEQDVLQPLVGTNKLFVYELAKDSFWRQIKTAAYALLFLDDACAYPTIRSAIPANNLYLEFIGKDEPGRLSRPNTAKGQAELQLEQPVHIHPTAQIDPTAKVCFFSILFVTICSTGNMVRLAHTFLLVHVW